MKNFFTRELQRSCEYVNYADVHLNLIEDCMCLAGLYSSKRESLVRSYDKMQRALMNIKIQIKDINLY